MIKIDVSKLSYSKETLIKEVVTFDEEKFKCHPPLLKVGNVDVSAKIRRYEDFIYIVLSFKANVTLQCSYSLVAFDTVLKGEEEFHFASYRDEDDDDLILYKGNSIELDKYIFDAISASVPPSPKAPGAKLPKGGKDYRVLSMEELEKEKEEETDSRFDALKDLEFDD